jgi:hypothetical protein
MIKRYREFIGESHSEIEAICQRYGIQNYTINADGSIDVEGNVNLTDYNLTQLPLQFRKVTGNFYCHRNQLNSLEESPREVGGDFSCHYNKIWSFIGPERIGGDFYFYFNPIEVIYNWFKTPELIERSTLMYSELFKHYNGNWYIDVDILEQLAEDLKVQLPIDYREELTEIGYQII